MILNLDDSLGQLSSDWLLMSRKGCSEGNRGPRATVRKTHCLKQVAEDDPHVDYKLQTFRFTASRDRRRCMAD